MCDFLKEKGLKTGHCFKRNKMLLYENKSTIIAKNSGKELTVKLIIEKFLAELILSVKFHNKMVVIVPGFGMNIKKVLWWNHVLELT